MIQLKKAKGFHSLHSRLTLWVMLTVLAVFVLITIIITNVIRKALLRSSEENAKSRIEIANQHINSILVGVEVAVDNVIPEIMAKLDKPDQFYETVRKILELNHPIIGSAIAFEPNYFPQKGEHFSPYAYRNVNDSICTKQLGTSEYQYHYMDWYQIPKLLKKSSWSEPYYDTGGGEQMMTTYSHPIYDKNGNMVAVLTADVSLNWLTDLVAKSDIELNSKLLGNQVDATGFKITDTFLYTHAYSFIIGRGATYITHPMSERILNDTYFVYSMETNDSIDVQIGYDMVDGLSGMREIIRDGVKFLICYAPIERTGWSMATVIPAKIIYGSSQLLSYLVLLIMFIGLVVLFLICNSVVMRITRPLARFADSADEVAKGNLDATLPDIKTKDEMARLSQSFSLMQTSLKQQMEELRQSTASKAAIESELKVASDIQMSMLPRAFPEVEGVDMYALMTPAREVGGDLYSFLRKGDELYFCLGDVSGKGVPASLFMAQVTRLFHGMASYGLSPADIANHMNAELVEDNEQSMFVTLFICRLNLKLYLLEYCNAGHNPPVIGNVDGQFSFLDMLPNAPIGLWPGLQYKGESIEFFKDRLLLIYSDGLNEAENLQQEQFGAQRIINILSSTSSSKAQDIVEKLKNEVDSFRNGAEPNDDLTMLCLKYHYEQDTD